MAATHQHQQQRQHQTQHYHQHQQQHIKQEMLYDGLQQQQRQRRRVHYHHHQQPHHPYSSLPRVNTEAAISLRLGPVSRARTFMPDAITPAHGYLPNLGSKVEGVKGAGPQYPRIVVRDITGRRLDTFTTLQEAIYRASWMRKKLGEYPKTQLEWRLPKAPVPSKPDFTRAGEGPGSSRAGAAHDVSPRDDAGHARLRRSHTGEEGAVRRIDMTTGMFVDVPTLEIPVDDVSFVRESLNHLPNLPAFTFLRHSLLAGRATYVHIVASILLHQKQLRSLNQLHHPGQPLSEDEQGQATGGAEERLLRMSRPHRQPEYQFPGFCTGCRRAGFCYGCQKNPKPHVHEDIPAMMGGGFRFYKRDRPRDPHPWKHPGNWQLPESEAELMKMIKEHGGLHSYEQAVTRARQEMLRVMEDHVTQDSAEMTDKDSLGSKYQRLKNLGGYPPYVTIVSTEDFADDRALSEFDDDEEEEDNEEEDEETVIEQKTEDKMAEGKSPVDEGRQTMVGMTSSLDTDSVQSRPIRVDTGIGTDVSEPEDFGRGRRPKVSIVDPKGEGESPARRHLSQQSKSSRTRSDSGSRSRSSAPKSRTTSRVEFTDLGKELEKEKEARLRMERAKANVPFGKKRNDVGYTAPKFFTVQKRTRAATVAKDPFSTERELNVPKGGTFQVKKSDRKATQFVEFGKGDRGWTAPKKFEVKAREKKTTVFWKPPAPKDKDGQKRRRRDGSDNDSPRGRRKQRDGSPDSGVGIGSGTDKEGTDANIAVVEEDKAPVTESGDKSDSQLTGGTDGQATDQPLRPKRREVVKKTRVERRVDTPPQSPKRLPSPPPFTRRATPPPTPPTPEPPKVEAALPELDLDLPSMPDLPDVVDREPEKRKQKMKFTVEPPPPMQASETPRKRRAAPRVRIIPKNLSRPPKSRPAEAPVTSEEMQHIQDPLDFLAKYCIINPDRIPFYEIIFETTVADQTPRYNKPGATDPQGEQTDKLGEGAQEGKENKKKSGSKSKKKKSQPADPKPDLRPDLFPADRGMAFGKPAMTLEEQHLEKLIYTLDVLQEKMTSLGSQLVDLELQRIRFIATRARSLYPEVTAPDYFPKLKKKKKKGKKGKKEDSAPPPRRLRPDEITDEVIYGRLDDKMLNEICKDPELKKTEVEMDIIRGKISEVEKRVQDLASERLLADAFCMNHYFLRQGLDPTAATTTTTTNSNNTNSNNNNNNDSNREMFRRQQSELYNRLRPQPNFEMNLEEVEDALQQINNHLLTEKEFFFLYNILNLTRREKINFRLFSIVAALSEKVTQLDPVIRKLINNFNYNALDIKMEKCKELFDLLESEHMPQGGAQAASLAVELTAGGLRPEHTKHVLSKFNRESRGVIDFLDFVTYVPLFVEIHKRIISDPLRRELDL